MSESNQKRLWVKWSALQVVGSLSILSCNGASVLLVYTKALSGYGANQNAVAVGAVSAFVSATAVSWLMNADIRIGHGAHCAQCQAPLDSEKPPQFCPVCGADVTRDGATNEGKLLSRQIRLRISAAILSVGIPIFLIATLKS